MIIVLGTPRSGSSFVTNWYANQYPEYNYMLSEKLGEYFHPDFFDTKDIDKETLQRIDKLTNKSIFKLHTGKEMSRHIWKFIADKPVIIVKRQDLLGQFISLGIGYTTNKWVNFKAKNTNGLKHNQTFYYKKEWFDDLADRILSLNKLENSLNIQRTVWYEDIKDFPLNGVLPTKQNTGSLEEKMNVIVNREDLQYWFEKFRDSNDL